MAEDRWRQIEEIFHHATERRAEERSAFLNVVCAGDGALRKEVQSLLDHDNEDGHTLIDAVAQAAERAGLKRDLCGGRIGVFQIIARLGEGGMGVVYQARDMQLDRIVAIKVLNPNRISDADRKIRFTLEAKAASALNHPNIVTIHSIIQEGENACIVMEYVAGHTLGDTIPKNGLPLTKALRIAIELADAMAAAHSAGIIHRDLKPGNIMLSESGRVKVLDFGLAKFETSRPNGQSGCTRSGIVEGTAAYISPEQAEGKEVDARTDIFAFGCVLYEMLTGRRAFQAESTLSTIEAILHREPKPAYGLPAKLDKLITRCLEKNREHRPSHMSEVKVALEEIGEQARSRPHILAPPHFRYSWLWFAFVPFLLAAGLFGLWKWQVTKRVEPLTAVMLNTMPGVKGYPSFSPGGDQLVFSWNGRNQSNPDIYLQRIGAGAPVRLTSDPRNDFNPVWAPDGRSIAFLRESSPGVAELRMMALSGGQERVLSEIRFGHLATPPFVTWCPSGDCLVVTESSNQVSPLSSPVTPLEGNRDSLFVVSARTGEKRRLTDPEPPMNDSQPAISPDGSLLVFRRCRGVATGELYLLRLSKGLIANTEPRLLTPAGLHANDPTWMPDGKEIVFSADGGLWKVAATGNSPPERLPFVGEDGLMPVISRPRPGSSPRLAYIRRYQDINIWRIDTSVPGKPASSAPSIAIASTRVDYNPRFSPNGKRVVFDSNRSGNMELWAADPDGSNPVQLTFMCASSGRANWSPDGRLIAFHSNLEDHWGVFLIPAAGGKPRRFAESGWPSFSQDGEWVYYSYKGTIWKQKVAGGDAVQVTRAPGVEAVESMDGKYVYYSQPPPGRSALWRIPASGGQPIKLLDEMIDFTVLKQGIYYLDEVSDEGRLQFLSFATGKSSIVARKLGKIARGLTVSPDRRRILYSRVDASADDLMLVENFR
jgi:eukaryotic-like serine/threonine-protein kinase